MHGEYRASEILSRQLASQAFRSLRKLTASEHVEADDCVVGVSDDDKVAGRARCLRGA